MSISTCIANLFCKMADNAHMKFKLSFLDPLCTPGNWDGLPDHFHFKHPIDWSTALNHLGSIQGPIWPKCFQRVWRAFINIVENVKVLHVFWQHRSWKCWFRRPNCNVVENEIIFKWILNELYHICQLYANLSLVILHLSVSDRDGKAFFANIFLPVKLVVFIIIYRKST